MRALFWVADVSLCPHAVEGARKLSGVSGIRALIPFKRVLPPPPDIITLGVGISHVNMGPHTSDHSTICEKMRRLCTNNLYQESQGRVQICVNRASVSGVACGRAVTGRGCVCMHSLEYCQLLLVLRCCNFMDSVTLLIAH